MTKKKPTPAQITALNAIQDGLVAQVNYGYGAWRIDGATPQVVGRCVSQGWARWSDEPFDNRIRCYLTVAGLAALSTPAEG